ncbi:MAG: PASTA domain-containing protein [Nitrospiraceae bacterium]|jgi:beta-lactam-binding protein with PASTA domain|nr:MAG: PASTA domain-containing protein [Nitrospiraceae bacterium]
MSNFLRIPLFFALFTLLGLSFGFITFKILSFSRTVEVPQLSNLTMLEANEALSRAGLYLKIEGEDFDPVIQAGRIIRQDIPSGNKVKEKRAIKVIVSKGPRISSIPLLVHEQLNDAESLLMQKGLSIGKVISVHSDSVAKGEIIAQKPEPHERLTDKITVLVSLGPHELIYICPDFMNKRIDNAKETAEKMGLVLESKGSGSIISVQKPKPGTIIKSTDKIYLELREETIDD